MASGIHPVLRAAARGELPGWACMSDSRKAHAGRVATLLEAWTQALGMRNDDRDRWIATGWLHDALKDADTEALRTLVGDAGADLPEPILHGPAAAARLEEEGVRDREVLDAVAWHTLGHPRLGVLGMGVYCADFLEPGREVRNKWRRKRRERMPGELETVTREILRLRIGYLLDRDRPVRRETIAFWNRLAGGEPWARASEV